MEVRDSVGVTVVLNTPPSLERTFATVDQEPVVSIDVADSSAQPYPFIMQAGAIRGDGSIVLLHGSRREFRVYDQNGSHRMTFGGPGDGPGKFGYVMQSHVLPGDTLLTVDVHHWRITWFDAAGAVVRTLEVAHDDYCKVQVEHPVEMVQVLPDGKLLAYALSSAGLEAGRWRSDVGFVMIDPHAGSADTLGWFKGVENYVMDLPDGLRPDVLPFAPDTKWAIGENRVYIGDNAAYRILAYGTDGALELVLQLDGSQRPVTPGDRAAYRELLLNWIVRDQPQELPFYERFLAEVPWPQHQPAFGRLVVDTQGSLWVQQYEPPGTVVTTYDVFSANGIWQGRVYLPDGLRPLEIGEAYILGQRRDETGRETVHLYRLAVSSVAP